MKAQFVHESLDNFLDEAISFERGRDPKDSMKIGDRVKRLEGMGNQMPLYLYFFNMGEEDKEGLDDEFLDAYERAKEVFLKNIDIAAVLDWFREEEIGEDWFDIDEYGTMDDAIEEMADWGREEFQEWALAITEMLSDNYGVNAEKYEEKIESL